MDMICQSINTKIEYVSIEYPPTEEILAEIERVKRNYEEKAELRALLRK